MLGRWERLHDGGELQTAYAELRPNERSRIPGTLDHHPAAPTRRQAIYSSTQDGNWTSCHPREGRLAKNDG
jgi:hypothetical protein